MHSKYKNIGEIAPIVLFVYNRPKHLRQTIQSLEDNFESKQSHLIIYSDGCKKDKDELLVKEVRNICKTIKGFNKIDIIERDRNYGLSGSIISGVTEVLTVYDRVIVLEDDLVTSPFFLKFMNDALEFYNSNEKVISIHGYIYPVQSQLPDTFFLRGADCWGWATWKRGWSLFESNGEKLLKDLTEGDLLEEFDWNGALNNVRMLNNFIKGKNDSWAIRWHASAFLKNKLTLYPGNSLVRNIGVDGKGTNVKRTNIYETTLSSKPIEINKIPIEENSEAKIILEKYFRKHKSFYGKLLRKLGME